MSRTLQGVQSGPELEFEAFHGYRRQMIDLAARAEAGLSRLELTVEPLRKVRERLESDRFKVMVLGEFKRGKSTVINSLLGAQVLPVKVVPCTAVITEIKWAREKRAVLHFRHPLPSPLPEALPGEIVRHIRRAGGDAVPALEVPIDELERYVAIQQPERDQADSIAESPYEKVEVYWPLDLCKNGVEIIDSPGLNEHESRARVTCNYLQQADAVLFVMLCIPLGAESEFRFIDDELLEAGHEQVFFICNRFDPIAPHDFEQIHNLAMAKLAPRTKLPEGVFFLSARRALEGRLRSDMQEVAASGILTLEAVLTRFLTRERGKVKLLQPAEVVKAMIKEARETTVPQQRALLDESLASLVSRYDAARPLLVEAERRKQQIIGSLSTARRVLNLQTRSEAEHYLRSLGNKIPGWVEGMQTENRIKAITLHPKKQAEALGAEVARKLKERLHKEAQDWAKVTLAPILDTWKVQTEQDLGERLKDLQLNLERIHEILTNVQSVSDHDLEGISTKKRAWAAGLGVFLSLPTALHGLRFGFTGYGVTLGAQLATIGLFFVLFGMNPISAALGAIFGSLLSFPYVGRKLHSEVLKRLGRLLQENFRRKIEEIAEEISHTPDAEVEEVSTALERAIQTEIIGVQQRVEAVLQAKRAGEAHVEMRKRMITEVEAELTEIDTALRQLTSAVSGN